jgi:hypothetical protein
MRGLSGSAVTDVAMATRVARVITLVCMIEKRMCCYICQGKPERMYLTKVSVVNDSMYGRVERNIQNQMLVKE